MMYIHPGYIYASVASTTRMNLNPSVADGATAVAYLFDTGNILSNATARLLSVKNEGVDRFYITAAGAVYANGSLLSPPTVVDAQFGNGADGNVTISSNTTLTRTMYYNNLTVNTGIVLTTAGFKIYVKGTLTLSGTGSIACRGGAGGNASAGTAGTAGTAPYTTARFEFQPIPTSGGTGGTGGSSGTTNGSGGAGALLGLTMAGNTNFVKMLHVGAGGGGGGAHGGTGGAGNAPSPTYIMIGTAGKTGGAAIGTASATYGGGGGGAGGGCMVIYCYILSGSGTFNVAGGAGGNGTGSSSTFSGNGSGGNGGSASVFYRTQSSWTGSFVATGGNAGTGGNGGSAGDLGVTQLVAI
jgi:hypothetical protein